MARNKNELLTKVKKGNNVLHKTNNSARQAAQKAAVSGATTSGVGRAKKSTSITSVSGIASKRSRSLVKEPSLTSKREAALKTAAAATAAKNKTASRRKTKEEIAGMAKKTSRSFNKQ